MPSAIARSAVRSLVMFPPSSHCDGAASTESLCRTDESSVSIQRHEETTCNQIKPIHLRSAPYLRVLQRGVVRVTLTEVRSKWVVHAVRDVLVQRIVVGAARRSC